MEQERHAGGQQLNGEQVAEWLMRHPGFLHQHPDVLMALDVPCTVPAGTVSLIQRKLRLLDGQLQQEHDQIQVLQARGALNRQQLQGVMSELSALVALHDPVALMAGFTDCLRVHFHADQVHFHLFTDQALPGPAIAGMSVDRADSRMRNLFAELFNVGRPLCGSLTEEYRQTLFGERAGRIRSTLLIPVGRSWEGLLALASEDVDRYQQGLLLDLLNGLTGIVAVRLEDALGLGQGHANDAGD